MTEVGLRLPINLGVLASSTEPGALSDLASIESFNNGLEGLDDPDSLDDLDDLDDLDGFAGERSDAVAGLNVGANGAAGLGAIELPPDDTIVPDDAMELEVLD